MYAIILADGKVGLMSTVTANEGEMSLDLHCIRVQTVLSNTPGICIIQLTRAYA